MDSQEANPLVSVVMPLYNSEKYIEEAIGSILKQTYQNWELIIVDDASSDSSVELVREIHDTRIKLYINDINRGIAYTRNRALDYCNGKYIALMDDDDVSVPYRFEKQVAYLEAHGEIDVLGGRFQYINEEGEPFWEIEKVLYNPEYIRATLLFHNVFGNCTVMFRNRIIKEYSMRYHDNCYGMEDFRFWIECSKLANLSNLDILLAKHRMMEGNETDRIKKNEKESRRKYYACLQRMSLEKSGFLLSDQEFSALSNAFTEEKTVCADFRTLLWLHEILYKIVEQAREKKMNNSEEIRIFCEKKMRHLGAACKSYFQNKEGNYGTGIGNYSHL